MSELSVLELEAQLSEPLPEREALGVIHGSFGHNFGHNHGGPRSDSHNDPHNFRGHGPR